MPGEATTWPPTSEQFSVVQDIERSENIVFLDSHDRKVLFRVDGLVIAVSDLAYQLLVTLGSKPLEERIRQLSARHGTSSVAACLNELCQISRSGILQELVERPRADPTRVQPSGLVLMVSQTCNLSCSYCYAGGGSYGSSVVRMDADIARSAIELMMERASSKKHFRITFFGGEPLLNFPLIRDTVNYCEERAAALEVSFHYSMTTNGTVLTTGILEFLREKRFGLMVSLDGPQEVHDELRSFRNGRGSFSVVTRNIRRLTDAGVPVQMRATVTKNSLSADAILEVIRLGYDLSCSRVVLSPVDTTKADDELIEPLQLCDLDLLHLEDVYQLITAQNLQRAERGEEEPVIFDPHARVMRALAQGRARGLTQCGACFGMAAVASDGTLYPCHRFVGMRPYAIGDVTVGFDLDRINEFFRRSEQACSSKCSHCWARQICCGLCYFHTADGNGDFHEPDEPSCESFRASLENSVGFLCQLRDLPHDGQRRYIESVQDV